MALEKVRLLPSFFCEIAQPLLTSTHSEKTDKLKGNSTRIFSLSSLGLTLDLLSLARFVFFPALFTYATTMLTSSIFVSSLQDSPSVKAPYKAQITAPKPLRALMGAKALGKTSNGIGTQTFTFDQVLPTTLFF